MAVIGFDLAAETLLKQAYRFFKPEDALPHSFIGLLNSVESSLKKDTNRQLRTRRDILHVHSIRNDVQHKGKYPDEDTVHETRLLARNFCNELSGVVWNTSFDDLSQLDFVEDETLRRLLEFAQDALFDMKIRRSLAVTEFAFFLGTRSLRSHLPDITRDYSDTEYRDSTDMIRKLMASSSGTADSVMYFSALFASGIRLADYRRLNDLADTLSFASRSERGRDVDKVKTEARVYWSKRPPQPDDARWAWNFTVGSIIRLQEQGLEPNVSSEWKDKVRLVFDWNSSVREFDA